MSPTILIIEAPERTRLEALGDHAVALLDANLIALVCLLASVPVIYAAFHTRG